MRGFREIRTRERMTEKDEKKSENYKQIKPQSDITIEECNQFFNNLFAQLELEGKEA